MRGRATEGPAPHRADVGRGDSEVDGGGGSEGTGRTGDVDQIGQKRRGGVMDDVVMIRAAEFWTN